MGNSFQGWACTEYSEVGREEKGVVLLIFNMEIDIMFLYIYLLLDEISARIKNGKYND